MDKFKQKLGPLPVWAWGVIGTIVVLGAYLFYRSQSGGSGSMTAMFGAGGTSRGQPTSQYMPPEGTSASTSTVTPPPPPVSGTLGGGVPPTATNFGVSQLSAPHLSYLSGNHQKAQALASLSAPHLSYLAQQGQINPAQFSAAHLHALLLAAHAPAADLTQAHISYLENAIKTGAAKFQSQHPNYLQGG